MFKTFPALQGPDYRKRKLLIVISMPEIINLNISNCKGVGEGRSVHAIQPVFCIYNLHL
jgi:hypothetical protein